MNRRIEVTLTIIGIIIACVTLFFGDNLYQQLTGQSFFSNNSPVPPVATAPATRTANDSPVTTAPVPSPTNIQSTDMLSGKWKGEWTSPSGYLFTCEMTLEVNQSNSISGFIVWTLVKSPKESEKSKIGLTGVEYIRGTYEPESRFVSFNGYQKDDPNTVIGLDKYQLYLSIDGNNLSGKTENHGDWQGILTAIRKP